MRPLDFSDLIIKAGAVLSALAVIFGAFAAIVRLIEKNKRETERNKKQDSDIAKMKKEQTLIIYAVRGCLDGLHQQGCNGRVTDSINRIDKYLNKAAHDQDDIGIINNE